jgi:hypothetical protein
MGSEWRDCIVVVFDLNAIKQKAKQRGVGVELMRRLHQVVSDAAGQGLRSISHAYAWNDSALLLAFVDGVQQYESVLRDADVLKRAIDAIGTSYAVAVKGQAFPTPPGGYDPRVTVIAASSYAMGNCFEITGGVGKKLKKPWYVDSRIAKHIRTSQTFVRTEEKLLPRETRRVYAYDGYLWEAP